MYYINILRKSDQSKNRLWTEVRNEFSTNNPGLKARVIGVHQNKGFSPEFAFVIC
jgi:hypothetical protein